MNANHPATLQQIVDSLRWWVEEYHVDGFRFDLGKRMPRMPNASLPACRAASCGMVHSASLSPALCPLHHLSFSSLPMHPKINHSQL